jgi:hypothetical protein
MLKATKDSALSCRVISHFVDFCFHSTRRFFLCFHAQQRSGLLTLLLYRFIIFADLPRMNLSKQINQT